MALQLAHTTGAEGPQRTAQEKDVTAEQKPEGKDQNQPRKGKAG